MLFTGETRNRVLFHRNPLLWVTCRLHFPPILKINDVLPTDFQEVLREELPSYSQYIGDRGMVVNGNEVLTLPEGVNESNLRNHEFSSSDGDIVVNLTASYISISTTSYTRWENFRAILSSVVSTFISCYQPSSFERVNLQYLDVVSREDLGLAGRPWRELLEPEVLGVLCSDRIPESSIGNTMQRFHIAVDEDIEMILLTGQAAKEDGESLFIIDSDFFSNKKQSAKEPPLAILDTMHSIVNRFFQWTLMPVLFDAMDPEVIGTYDA